MKKWWIFLGVLFLVIGLNQLVAGLNFPSAPVASNSGSPIPVKQEQVRVLRVIDGDTIELSDKRRVRYIGINAPEVVDPEKPVECFGKEAKSENQSLVEGKEVILQKDLSETDKYGRLIRYVFIGDKMINEELVRGGFARASSYAPDVKYADTFRKAEQEARENQRGLWSKCIN